MIFLGFPTIFSFIIYFNQNSSIKECDGINFIPRPAGTQLILINNNSDLAFIATSGNGSQSNPYIIENHVINGQNTKACIVINNTDKYFTLKNCTLHNATYGIYLNNVSHGFLRDNILHDNGNSGIYLNNSHNNTLYGNTITYNNETAIKLSFSHDNNLYTNTLYYNDMYGIFLNNSKNNDLIGNNIWDNYHSGVYMNSSNNNTISGNFVNNHLYGILLRSSNHSQVVNNDGYGNNQIIVEIECEGNYFENNFPVEPNGRNDNYNPLIIDFTIIILISIIFFLIPFTRKIAIIIK